MLDVIVAQYGGTIHMGNSTDAMHALNEDKAFQLVVFCAKEFPPPAIALDPRETRRRQTRVYYVPMNDEEVLTRDEMFMASRAANLVAAAFLKRRKVLVTCMEGRNRSGLVTALALDMLSSEGGSAALAAVRERRRRARALTNPTFVKLLENIPPRSGGPRAIVLGTGERRSLVL